ncbi:unnamed protein product [Candidula unifasciata]|uniref:MD-2-related lipid-recognition domain-containing protein n=1 Tax=Candidula unifasciata TaxID=100452 RepID=A0A8S3ZID4_9EUPU|nr:unnamed protein product [Candidula unifasciata]
MQHWIFTCVFLSLTALAVALLQQPKDVISFSEEEGEKLDFWLHKLIQEKSKRLTTFKYNNCGDPTKEVANITTLIIGPDPLVFPGPLRVQFSGIAKQTIQSPVRVALVLEVKVGSIWVKIPCIQNLGSCTYEDLCELLAQITECPAPLVSAGIPCACPYKQGPYSLPQAEFDILVALFPAGDYHAVANVTNGVTSIACVELFVTFG